MNKNTEASKKFRAKKEAAGLKEIRGIFADIKWHSFIKGNIRALIEGLKK